MTMPKDTDPKDAPGVDDAPTAHLQARILAEAIPHLIRYDEQTVVVKFGGNAMGDQALAEKSRDPAHVQGASRRAKR